MDKLEELKAFLDERTVEVETFPDNSHVQTRIMYTGELAKNWPDIQPYCVEITEDDLKVERKLHRFDWRHLSDEELLEPYLRVSYPPGTKWEVYLDGERLPDPPEPRIFLENKRHRARDIPATDTAVAPPMDVDMDDSRSPTAPPYSPESFPLPTLEHPSMLAIQSVAPFAESPKKRRKLQVVDDGNVWISGTPVAKYLDLASKWIVPCWWDVSHTVCRLYCMPAVESRAGSLSMIRGYGVHVSLHLKEFKDHGQGYVMLCDCDDMKFCCSRIIHDGSSSIDFTDWYSLAYWFQSSTGSKELGECVHIQSLRQHLGWKSPLLAAANLQWLEPIPVVTLFGDVPVISMATANESRVYIMKWGQRYKCKQCSSTACFHIRSYFDRDAEYAK